MSLEELNDGVRPGHNATFSLSSGSGSKYGFGHASYTAQLDQIRGVALPSPEYSADYIPRLHPIPEFAHPSPDSNTTTSAERDERPRQGAGRR
jgi:hypothetical protein